MNILDTAKRIFSVFACDGNPMHVHSGLAVLVSGNQFTCPTCNATMKDITKTPIGKAYFAFHRPDLGAKQ